MAKKSLDEIARQLESKIQSDLHKQQELERIIWEQREKARQEYLKRNQMYERTSILSNAAVASAAAGGGKSSTVTPEVEPTFWALTFNEDSNGVGYAAQSMDQDPDGYIYVASISFMTVQNSLVRKLSPSGDVIWEKTLNNVGTADMEVVRVMAVPDGGGVIILYKGAIRKLDNDGNLEWSFLQDSGSTVEFSACCLNTPNDNETFYVFGTSADGLFQIAEFLTYFGTKQFNRSIEIVGETGYTSYVNMFLNSSGDVVVAMSYNIFTVATYWYTTIVVIEGSSLSSGVNILNQWDLDPYEYNSVSSPAPNNQNIRGLAVDLNDNIIACGYNSGITLIPADFSVGIGLMLDIVLDSQSFEHKSLAVPNGTSGDVFIIGQDGPSVIKVVKLSSFVPQFSYTIESLSENGLSIEGENSIANSCIKIVDGAMLITASYDDGTPKELLLKLPLTNLSGYPDTGSTTYGDFIFTNSPIIQNTIFPSTTTKSFSIDNNSSWLSNDSTQVSGFSSPSITQTSTQTSFD